MDKSEIVQKIRDKILKTEAQILEYRELTKPIGPENAIGRISRMDAINNRSVNEAALRQIEQKIKDLKRVLENAGNKNFA